MISINEILTAVKGLLCERFTDIPQERAYTNLTPSEFERPALLAAGGKLEMADASRECVQVTLPVVIDFFEAVDTYDNSHIETLTARLTAALELFAVEGLRVGDRVLHVVKCTGEYNSDRAEATITLQYEDDRPGGQEWPLMREIKTTIKEE